MGVLLAMLLLPQQAAPALPPVSPRLCLAVGRSLSAWAGATRPTLTAQDWTEGGSIATQVKRAEYYAASVRTRFGAMAVSPIDAADAAALSIDDRISYARACERGG
jgi:hypothetical protein